MSTAYRSWYQRARSRALRRLETAHKAEYRALLEEEKSVEPYTTTRVNPPQKDQP